MQEIEFTKEDEYCIRNFGYNTVGDYENLKQLEDKEHLIVEELEYRLQQKENIIEELKERSLSYSKEIDRLLDIKEEVREYIENAFATGEEIFKVEILEILDKENK